MWPQSHLAIASSISRVTWLPFINTSHFYPCRVFMLTSLPKLSYDLWESHSGCCHPFLTLGHGGWNLLWVMELIAQLVFKPRSSLYAITFPTWVCWGVLSPLLKWPLPYETVWSDLRSLRYLGIPFLRLYDQGIIAREETSTEQGAQAPPVNQLPSYRGGRV